MAHKTRSPAAHRCIEYKCLNCQEFVMTGHKCTLNSIPMKNPIDKLLFFYFECTQDNPDKIHKPVYVVAQSVCTICKDSNQKCQYCGSRCEECKDRKKPPCTTCGHN